MPEETVQYLTSDPGYVKVKYKKSPRMSTYLLAVIVAEFQYKEKIFDDGYQVWKRKDKHKEIIKQANNCTKTIGIHYYTFA